MLLKTIECLKHRLSGQSAPGSSANAVTVTPADIIAKLYTAWGQAEPGSYYFRDPTLLKATALADRLPLPPAHLRMGYSVDNDEVYLRGGETSAASLRTIMQEYDISLQTGSAMLDWGCATGRALRWFLPETQQMEVWGADQDELSMVWAKENLNPPFHFVTCTAYPHLPFADNKFDLIYGLSVFTHLEHFRDLWLMEMQRVLKRDGFAIFTIHDEHTVQFFIEHGRPAWIPAKLALREIADHETTIIHGNLWYETYTFFTGAYIRKEWGRYFQVLGIRPFSDGYQSAVVLRKR